MPKEFKYIDVFSGCGGLSLGMHSAGWKALFSIEKNHDAFQTLNYNLEMKKHFDWPIWLPKSEYDINDILNKYPEELEKLSNRIELVTGGPPCQGFSTAGRRNEEDDRNSLIDSYLRLIDIVNPNSVLFENVRGFTQTFKKENNEYGKNYSNYIIIELEKRGYSVSYKLMDFSNFGVPQKRIRFILFASKIHNTKKFFTILEKNTVKFLSDRKLHKRISIQAALSDLEGRHGKKICPDCQNFKSGVYGSATNNYQRYCRSGARKNSIPDSHRFANHKTDTVDRFSELHSQGITNTNLSKILREEYGVKKNCFSILNKNLPSPTLTSNPDDHLHYSEPRTLTVREYARIQSFPDWYEFKGKYTTGGDARKHDVPRYTQIGNAIPPLFAEQMGYALKILIDNEQ